MKKSAKKIKRVGVIGNSEKLACAAAIKQAARLVVKSGRQILSESLTARLARLDATVFPDTASLARQVDLLLVFGGDGTMLRVARETAGLHTPILGINTGNLGFLTAFSVNDLAKGLQSIWAGEVVLESRMLIQASGRCNGQPLEQAALNDIVITHGLASRLIELEVRVDGQLLTIYRCDGLIISSPTGSTAYSLAAGGAVVFPTADVIELTPICPHTLSNRSLILPSSSTIDVRVVCSRPATILSADGQVVSELMQGDLISIRRSGRPASLMHLASSSFGDTLRRKLHWRGTTL